jgi:hypothetical protein
MEVDMKNLAFGHMNLGRKSIIITPIFRYLNPKILALS